ncbi:thioesterase domain-containing protein [Streptomyces sp. NPDC023838]|uniref:thioesterase domain-containing protein n=1 Tax=Streptomyces sp. NPDC023838 TaxID=3154325 RepID=UPI003410D5CC
MTQEAMTTGRGTEQTVASVVEIFEDLLGVSPILPDEDFFDAGGHSLLAVQLVARVNAAFATDIPLSALFDTDGADGVSPTAIARLVAGDAGAQGSDLVMLARGVGVGAGSARDARMVCVPPAGGEVVSLREFAATFAEAETAGTVQAFQFPPIAPGEDHGIGALAARLLAALPDDPADQTVLLGWSMGGIVAFEAARLRAAAARVPAHVVLVDSYPAGTIPDSDDFGIVPGLVEELQAAIGHRVPVDLAAARALPLLEGVELVMSAPAGLTDAERDVVRAKVLMLEAHVTAARAYQLQPYEGPVTLVQAADTDAGQRDAARQAWQAVCRDLRTVVVPGQHLSLFGRPYVEGLARAVLEAVG